MADEHITKARDRPGRELANLVVTDERFDVQIVVLSVLPHGRALEAVGFGLREPLLAGREHRR